uniref:Uncharacterized protein n=1 Tax=Phytophthora ramorum TaxID=164328 RepID=H3H5V5_PHYRM
MVRVVSCRFMRISCSEDDHPLFRRYYASQINARVRCQLLRCFPHCCPEHIQRCYCGSSVHVLVTFAAEISAGSQGNLVVCARFEPSRMAPLWPSNLATPPGFHGEGEDEENQRKLQPGEIVSLPMSIRSADKRQGCQTVWTRADREGDTKQKYQNAVLFVLNNHRFPKWLYSYDSSITRTQRDMTHHLVVYVCQLTGTSSQSDEVDAVVLARYESPGFSLISYRRSGNNGNNAGCDLPALEVTSSTKFAAVEIDSPDVFSSTPEDMEIGFVGQSKLSTLESERPENIGLQQSPVPRYKRQQQQLQENLKRLTSAYTIQDTMIGKKHMQDQFVQLVSDLYDIFGGVLVEVSTRMKFIPSGRQVASLPGLVDDVLSLLCTRERFSDLRADVMALLMGQRAVGSLPDALNDVFQAFTALVREAMIVSASQPRYALRQSYCVTPPGDDALLWNQRWLLEPGSVQILLSTNVRDFLPEMGLVDAAQFVYEFGCVDIAVEDSGSSLTVQSPLSSSGDTTTAPMTFVLDGKLRVFRVLPDGLPSMIQTAGGWSFGDYTAILSEDKRLFTVNLFSFSDKTMHSIIPDDTSRTDDPLNAGAIRLRRISLSIRVEEDLNASDIVEPKGLFAFVQGIVDISQSMVRVVSCRFTRLSCSEDDHPLFRRYYARSNRERGVKRVLILSTELRPPVSDLLCPTPIQLLRCFPHCCPEHVQRCYCGTSIHVQLTLPSSLVATGKRQAKQTQWIRADREGEVKQKALPKNAALYVLNNHRFPKWLYSYDSSITRTQREMTHHLVVYVFQLRGTSSQPGEVDATVLARHESSGFSLISYRRSGNNSRDAGCDLPALETASDSAFAAVAADTPDVAASTSGDMEIDSCGRQPAGPLPDPSSFNLESKVEDAPEDQRACATTQAGNANHNADSMDSDLVFWVYDARARHSGLVEKAKHLAILWRFLSCVSLSDAGLARFVRRLGAERHSWKES